MTALRIRRLAALLMTLALALGPVGHAAAMADMGAAMAATDASDMGMPDCDKCSGESGAASAAICFAQCTVPSAILPAVLLLQAVVVSSPDQPAKSTAFDRHRPPDPDPPRSIALI